MSARTVTRDPSFLLPVLMVALAGPVAAQEQTGTAGDVLDDALVVAVEGVLERLHQQGSVPAEPRVVVTPDEPRPPGEMPPTADDGPAMGRADVLAEGLGARARVADLEEVQRCPSDPTGACILEDVDAVVTIGALEGTAEHAAVDVLVTWAVPHIVHDPMRSAAYRVGLSRAGNRWTLTSMRRIRTMGRARTRSHLPAQDPRPEEAAARA